MNAFDYLFSFYGLLLGGMNVWLTMWHIRANVDVTAWQMVAAACVALPYVFISRAMFPGQERQQERSLEEHYLRHRILILTILMIPPLASAISKVVLDRSLPRSRVCRAVSLREEEALPGLREEEGRASERFASWAQRPPELAKGRRRCVRLGLPLPR